MSAPAKYLVLAVLAAPAIFGISLGHVDDFEDGTTMGWGVPGPSPLPPLNIATGGPGGAGDNYLQLRSGGAGLLAGSRLSVLNSTPNWSGDYRGFSGIAMWVNNFGGEEAHLRLLLESFGDTPGPPDNLALSKDAVIVPAGSGWLHVLFPITPDALLPGVLGTVEGALEDVDTLRLYHNPAAEFPGPGIGPPPVVLTLGVDNIEAAVPEPATLSLIAAGLAAFALRRRRAQ